MECTATVNTDKTKELNLIVLDFYFEFEPEFVFSYTPDALRAVCKSSNQVSRLFILRMSEMLASAPNTPAIERPGFVCALSEHDWLRKMITLARGLEAFNYDVDESCYGELNAVRQGENAANKARRASHRVPASGKESSSSDLDKASGEEKQHHTEEQAGPEHFLQGFRKGQLQISNIITRSRILCVGARGKGRQLWTEEAPLIVRDVSGFKAG